MDKDSMQSAVIKLIEKYIPDRNDLKELIKEDTDSVKYIVAEIDRYKTKSYEEVDLDIIKDVFFFWG